MARRKPYWLFAVGLVVGVLLMSLHTPVGMFAALAWAFVVLPHGALWLRHRHGGAAAHADREAAQVDYWRSSDSLRAGR